MKIYLILPIVMFSVLGFAQPQEAFDQATIAYNEGKYEEAIALYEKILSEEYHSAAVYFNLANCYYKLDEIAPSIYNYEKALLLSPGDKEIKENLTFAQNMRLDAIQPLPKTALGNLYSNISSIMHFDKWAITGVVFVMLFVLLCAAYMLLYESKSKRISFIGAGIFLLLALLSILMAYLGFENEKNDHPAIVFKSEVAVTAEPNARSDKAFLLHEGTKVWIIEGLEDWSKIMIEDGQTGWIPSSAIKAIKTNQ